MKKETIKHTRGVTATDVNHTSFAHRERDRRRTIGRIREKDDGKNEKEEKKNGEE